jgi:hypothetical protein
MTQQEIGFTTDELATLYKTKPQSIRWRYSETGSYFGLIPRKLPNGRLIWDGAKAIAMFKGTQH